VSSDHNTAGIRVSHNLYILRSVVEDLIKGYHSDAAEHRHIAVAKTDLAEVIAGLQTMLAAMEKADTCQRLN
jgi:hypothetical protein